MYLYRDAKFLSNVKNGLMIFSLDTSLFTDLGNPTASTSPRTRRCIRSAKITDAAMKLIKPRTIKSAYLESVPKAFWITKRKANDRIRCWLLRYFLNRCRLIRSED